MTLIDYGGWPNCYRLTNGLVEAIATTDVGPRIIRFGFVGQENEFKEYPAMAGLTGGEVWRIYGGHRLWHAPEDRTRTYFPDNGPVELVARAGAIQLIQPPETTTGIQKEMELHLEPGRPALRVTHRLRNVNLWPVELAPWALSVMAAGGTAIIPLPPPGSHRENLQPGGNISLWAYTNLADPRWTWGRKYILLRQDERAGEPQKLGVAASAGWAAYARNGHLFVKKFSHRPEAIYPDRGCSVEVFADADMLEVETLGPLATLSPGQTVEHTEDWLLFEGVSVPRSDADVDETILPRISPG